MSLDRVGLNEGLGVIRQRSLGPAMERTTGFSHSLAPDFLWKQASLSDLSEKGTSTLSFQENRYWLRSASNRDEHDVRA